MRVSIYEFISPALQQAKIEAALKVEWLASHPHADSYGPPIFSNQEVESCRKDYPLGRCTGKGTIVTYVVSNKFEESCATAIVHLDNNTIREIALDCLVVIPDAEV